MDDTVLPRGWSGTVSMLLNPWLHHVFILKEAFQSLTGHIFIRQVIPVFFYVHLAYCYGLVAWIVLLLMVKDPPYGAFVPQEIYIHPGVFSGNHHM